MKKTTLNVVIFGLVIVSLGCAPGVSAARSWAVCPGDEITWEINSYYDNGILTTSTTWTLVVNVTNFAQYLGQDYVNGTTNQNGTEYVDFLNSLVQYEVGPSNDYYVNTPIDSQGELPISMALIETVSGLNSIGTRLQEIATFYGFNYQKDTTNGTSFRLWGTVPDTNPLTYDAVINYTSDRVLYSIEDHMFIDVTTGGDDVYENYDWIRTSYIHGTCPPGIPGYSIMLVVFLAVATVAFYVLKRCKSLKIR